MYLIIDAWLERKDPQIRLIDAGTGQEVFRLGTGQVRALIDSGELYTKDLEEASLSCSELFYLMSERRLIGTSTAAMMKRAGYV